VRERCKRTLKRELNESLKSLRVEAMDTLSGKAVVVGVGGVATCSGVRHSGKERCARAAEIGFGWRHLGRILRLLGFTSQHGSWKGGEATSDDGGTENVSGWLE